MANLWYGNVDTNGKYVDLETLYGSTLTPGTTYRLQPLGTIAMCISSTEPTEGGFVIYDSPIVRFELAAGEKVWVKTYNGVKVPVNLAS